MAKIHGNTEPKDENAKHIQLTFFWFPKVHFVDVPSVPPAFLQAQFEVHRLLNRWRCRHQETRQRRGVQRLSDGCWRRVAKEGQLSSGLWKDGEFGHIQIHH